MNESNNESIHFVTGRLAEPLVREIVGALAIEEMFEYTIDVLPITVAALMTPKWIKRHLRVPDTSTRIIFPGYLGAHVEELKSSFNIPCECGPKDIRDLPSLFGRKRFQGADYGRHTIEIIAEINYAPRLSVSQLIEMSSRLVADGADRIDLGCEPGQRWQDIANAVRELTHQGIRTSIDTFDPWEAREATKAGATLVLSINKSNREACIDWGTEVVVVPDEISTFESSIESTVEYLDKHRVPFRLDPILEPIGCGFAESLGRYLATRRKYPEAAMMMGIGNLTELTDVDSAGINMLLMGFCEELQIRSVLTTQVIAWAQSSVQECDIARRLSCFAVGHKTPPKKLDDRLVMLRDTSQVSYSEESIVTLGKNIRDNNFRILIDDKRIHLLSADVHIRGTDPFEMMDELLRMPTGKELTPAHTFYLGFELAKALTALTLGKRYEQDVALRWGFLTRDERHRRVDRRR